MIDIINKWGLLVQINEAGEMVNGTIGGLSIRQQKPHQSEEWIYLEREELQELFSGLTDYFSEN